jgi:4-amino-4-deoxy-L-arabinose transferase-like glycosyltransferase
MSEVARRSCYRQTASTCPQIPDCSGESVHANPPRDRAILKRLLLVIVLALALRVTYVGAVTRHDHQLYDAFWYTIGADTFGQGKGPIVPVFTLPRRPSAEHPPLTSIILAPVARLTHGDETAMRFTMAFLGCIVVLEVGLIAREIAGDRAGLIAAGLASIYPNLWVNDGLIMSETITALVVALAILLLYRFTHRPSLRLAMAIGFSSGLGMLTRAEIGLMLPLVIVPTFLLTAVVTVRRRLACVGIAIVVAVVTISPWVIRNLTTFDRPVFLSTGVGPALLGANCAKTYSGRLLGYWDPYCGVAGVPRSGDPSVYSENQRRRAFEYMSTHPGGLARASLARVGRVWSLYRPLQMARINRREGRPEGVSILGFAFFYLLLPLAVVGALVLHRRGVTLVPLLGQFALVTLTALAFYGIVRFRVPAEVSTLVLAAITLDAWTGGGLPRTVGAGATSLDEGPARDAASLGLP